MSTRNNAYAALKELDTILKESKLYQTAQLGKPGIRKKIQVGDRIQKFGPLAAKAARIAAVRLGAETLEECMQIVPIDTGELARSGRLTVQGKTYVTGKAYVTYDSETGEAEEALTGIDRIHHLTRGTQADIDDLDNYAKRRFNVFISFNRTSPTKPNLAHFVHEEVKPHDQRPPRPKRGSGYWAKLEGRGGPYLKGPWESHFAPNLYRYARKELEILLRSLK